MINAAEGPWLSASNFRYAVFGPMGGEAASDPLLSWSIVVVMFLGGINQGMPNPRAKYIPPVIYSSTKLVDNMVL